MLDRELKKGSAELVILALVDERPRHGYDMSQLIEQQSDGAVRFTVTSLYPLLTGLKSVAGFRGGGSKRPDSAGVVITGSPGRDGRCLRSSARAGSDSSPRSIGSSRFAMPDWKAEITSRLPDPSAVRDDVLEEMAQHIEDRYGALVRGGLLEDQAYAEVLEELTDSEVLTAMLRPTSPRSPAEPPVFGGRTAGSMTRLGRDLFQDLRYGARTLRRTPRFTFASILALALGIGVNTVVFTAHKALVARPIDARDPGTMVNIALRLQSGETMAQFSYPDFEAYRDGLRSFSGVIAFSIEQQLALSDADGAVRHRRSDTGPLLSRLGLLPPPVVNAEIASTFVVSENYFAVLGVAPIRGRAFDAMSAAELAASPPVLISENYWHDRFAGDPDIVGKIIRLNGAAFAIAGVTPANFTGTSIAVPNFWLPLSLYPSIYPGDRRLHDREKPCRRMLGRLAPGVTMREAQAEATVLSSSVHALHEPTSDLSRPTHVVISPGSPLPGINSRLRMTIALIVAATTMVLVIACANAAGLQLARATARQQELGVRLSLGASRSRLIRQLLTESALLGLLAGAAALPVTWALMRLAVIKWTEQMPPEVTLVLNVTPDVSVFACVLALSLFAGLVFGVAPALAGSRSALFSTTRSSGASPGRGRLRHALIAAQVAVSLTLMIAGGLLVRSAIQALTMDTGYDADRVVAVTLKFSGERKDTREARAAVVNDLRDRFATVAGVTAITSARAPSDNGARRAAVSLNGDTPTERNARATVTTHGSSPIISTPSASR